MTGRDRILTLLSGGRPDHVPLMPITMMRAADAAGVRYRDYATDHHVLAEAQILTAQTFDFDYVSVISDPAREASDLGAAIEWFDDQPPAIIEAQALLGDKAVLARLQVPDPHAGKRMRDRIQGVALLHARAGATLAIEGWVEGPCAMAADLRGLNTVMLDFFDDRAFVEDLFEFVIEMELRFARAQVEAGADIIGVGDAASSLIGPRLYHEFVLPYERRLIHAIRQMGAKVRLHICGNTRRIFEDMSACGPDIIDLDSMAPLAAARAEMREGQVLLGNLDPVRGLRDGTPESIYAALATCRHDAGGQWIVGAGCEIPRGTPDENILAMTRFAREAT